MLRPFLLAAPLVLAACVCNTPSSVDDAPERSRAERRGEDRRGERPRRVRPVSEGAQAQVVDLLEDVRLTRDLAEALSARWDQPPHRTLAERTTLRLDRLTLRLQRQLPDDTPVPRTGVFPEPDRQARYNELIQRGTASAEDSLRVGAEVLDDLLATLAPIEAIDRSGAAERLSCGTRHHLQSFLQAMDAAQISWEPSHLSIEQADALRQGEPVTCRRPERGDRRPRRPRNPEP